MRLSRDLKYGLKYVLIPLSLATYFLWYATDWRMPRPAAVTLLLLSFTLAGITARGLMHYPSAKE